MGYPVTQKAELALQNFLKAHPPGDIAPENIFIGESTGINEAAVSEQQSNPLPNLIIDCDRAPFDTGQPDAGNWIPRVTVLVQSAADDTPREIHMARAGSVFDLIITDTIAADLSQALDAWTAFDLLPVEMGYRRQGRLWVSYLIFDLSSAPSDVV